MNLRLLIIVVLISLQISMNAVYAEPDQRNVYRTIRRNLDFADSTGLIEPKIKFFF